MEELQNYGLTLKKPLEKLNKSFLERDQYPVTYKF